MNDIAEMLKTPFKKITRVSQSIYQNTKLPGSWKSLGKIKENRVKYHYTIAPIINYDDNSAKGVILIIEDAKD